MAAAFESTRPPPSTDPRPRGRRVALWIALLIVGAVFLVRLFWLREYPVRSGSMEPAIHGAEKEGEYVLVAFGTPARHERFDLVVVEVEGRPDPLVKRVVGLPGEAVEIREGDLYIDGALLGPEVPRPEPVLVFDDRVQELERWFQMGSTASNPWTREGEAWSLDARSVPRGANGGMMFLRRELDDGYLTRDGEEVAGTTKVHDAILSCEIALDESPAVVRLGLHEKGDNFEVVLEPGADGSLGARLLRRRAEHPLELLASTNLRYERGRWHALCFSNVDDHLAFSFDGRRALEASYPGNVPHPTELEQQPIRWQSYGHRVSLGGEAGRARFRSVRIRRDLHYTPLGEQAVRAPLQLAPDEIFLLGDNSSRSVDGRSWGPSRLDSIVGRPLLVLWPLRHARPLHGARRPIGCGGG